jgi:hypothetical protein
MNTPPKLGGSSGHAASAHRCGRGSAGQQHVQKLLRAVDIRNKEDSDTHGNDDREREQVAYP